MRTLDKALWQYSKEKQGTTHKPELATEETTFTNTMIPPPHGGKGAAFPADDLIKYIQSTRLIIEIRQNYTSPKDTKQVVQEVIDALVTTVKFEAVGGLVCPDSGERCKGVKIK